MTKVLHEYGIIIGICYCILIQLCAHIICVQEICRIQALVNQ